jgi:hypothetical protein
MHYLADYRTRSEPAVGEVLILLPRAAVRHGNVSITKDEIAHERVPEGDDRVSSEGGSSCIAVATGPSDCFRPGPTSEAPPRVSAGNCVIFPHGPA